MVAIVEIFEGQVLPPDEGVEDISPVEPPRVTGRAPERQ